MLRPYSVLWNNCHTGAHACTKPFLVVQFDFDKKGADGASNSGSWGDKNDSSKEYITWQCINAHFGSLALAYAGNVGITDIDFDP
jgi:hypothetical protein